MFLHSMALHVLISLALLKLLHCTLRNLLSSVLVFLVQDLAKLLALLDAVLPDVAPHSNVAGLIALGNIARAASPSARPPHPFQASLWLQVFLHACKRLRRDCFALACF